MTTKRYYRVQTGFGPNDFTQIEEDELERCVRAQITGRAAVTPNGTISGNVIQRIYPDLNRALGLSRSYALQGEDYRIADAKGITSDHRVALEAVTASVAGSLGDGRPANPSLRA